MISRRELLRSVAIAMAGSRVGGIPGQAAGADHRSDLVIAHGADISSLDPHLSAAVQDTDVSLNLFDTLVSRRWDNRLYPSLALTWTLRNPVTWEFVLRPGVVFHNGDPFTSSDVTFSIERTFDPRAKTLMATVFTTVDGIDAVAPHLVRFRMKYPDPLLPARLALFGGQILPRCYVESM